MITVHLVFNAHIDPIWLWPWQSGLDTLLATCRSACDRLDAHPDVRFSRGEAWAYSEIEAIDPALFARIRKHVDEGRWHIVGGWWLQPDCNGPGGVGLEKQIELGKEYFEKRFRRFPRVGYNVDSFGHAATLPGLMRKYGQDRYVFMRPQEDEMALPARVFRWRGDENGPEVVAFRIAKAYTTRDITIEHVQAAMSELPPGIDHTMCFVGFGDHGGGPTEDQIAWCREHIHKVPGAKLVFSSPDQFFDAIADRTRSLPLVVGELQHHSVGCYSVYRAVKTGVHKAEQKLVQAEIVRQHDPRPDPQDVERLKEAWRWVCFNHFHDTFGGTCIPSAYDQVHAQLGYSYAAADETVQRGMRRMMNELPDDTRQRIVLFNASDRPYDGYAIHEPWLEAEHWQPYWRLVDEKGRPVPHQRTDSECLVPDDYLFFLRLLFRIQVKPGELRVLRIEKSGGRPIEPHVQASPAKLSNDTGTSIVIDNSDDNGLVFDSKNIFPMPRLELVDDPTDTWTHEVDRFTGKILAKAEWTRPKVIDQGPLMASIQRHGRIGANKLVVEYRIYAGEPFVEFLLQVYWSEWHRLLKLTFPMPSPLERRQDGIPGGELLRTPDGKERPLRERTLLHLRDGRRLGIVCPDMYALDATADAVRLTLLRSPKMAHHCAYNGPGHRPVYTDQGMHEFRLRCFGGPQVTGELLDHHAMMFQRPLVTADLTRGMPPQALTPYRAVSLVGSTSQAHDENSGSPG